MYEYFNPNPLQKQTVDCAVRAIAKALDVDWEEAYIKLCSMGMNMGELPNCDVVWGAVLRKAGFRRRIIPDECPDCYTAEDFLRDNPHGTYVFAFGGHTATAKDGVLFDSWNSLNEVPVYVWYKEE